MNGTHVVTNEVWRYSGTWESQTPLRMVRQSHRTEMIGNEIHHIGGCQTYPCRISDRLRFVQFDHKLK